MTETKNNEPEKVEFLNLLILLLSVYVLVALLVDTLFKLPVEVSRILNITDNAICIIFLIDFGTRLYKAEHK